MKWQKRPEPNQAYWRDFDPDGPWWLEVQYMPRAGGWWAMKMHTKPWDEGPQSIGPYVSVEHAMRMADVFLAGRP